MVQKKNNLKFEIINLLLKSKSHIREIAKKLNESHSTILRKLNFLKEEGIVDSKIEGKNKIFYLKNNLISQASIFQAELYKLLELLKKHPELSIIFNEILEKINSKLIILFGSYAKGLEKSNSDIDIYIETEDRKIKKTVESINSKINVKIGPFNKKSFLIKEIIKNHIIIKGVEEFYDKKIFE